LGRENAIAVTGGKDGAVQLYRFDQGEGKLEGTIKAHNKRVRDVVSLEKEEGHFILSAGQDKTVKCWQVVDGDIKSMWKVEDEDEVVELSVHPTKDYVVSFCASGSWTFLDVKKGRTIARSQSQDEARYSCGQVHPDGLILATGSEDGAIRIWEIKGQQCVATLKGHQNPVASLCFSENGYYLASVSKDEVKVWDLRKSVELKGWSMGEDFGNITSVKFDNFGQYLAVSGNKIQ
jgi:pre-mRNA-processing factor 19